MLADGVRARTINNILKSHDISYYSYDINSKCFDKYISRCHKYPAIVYYSVNSHMYIVRAKKEAQSLLERARYVETYVKNRYDRIIYARKQYIQRPIYF